MVILLCFSLKVADVSLSESGHLVPWWLTSHKNAGSITDRLKEATEDITDKVTDKLKGFFNR